jgi:hypothetical protein
VLHAHLPKGISACAADIVLAILPTTASLQADEAGGT